MEKLTLQDICDKYAFEIYEWGKIRKDFKVLKIEDFWGDIERNDLRRNLYGQKVTTALNTIKFIKPGETILFNGTSMSFNTIVEIEENK